MSISIRTRKMGNRKLRLLLRHYDGKKQYFETLDLFMFNKPRSLEEREQNKYTLDLAEIASLKRELQIE